MRLDLYEQGGYAGGGISENGGNITGPLLLAGNPSQTLEAVPKQYVDAYANSLSAGSFTSGTLNAARLPALAGDVSSPAGSSTFTLKNSGVVPGSYGKIIVNSKGIVTGGENLSDSDVPFGIDWSKINSNSLPTTLAGYGILDGASSSGGSFSGLLKTTATPTQAGHAVTKQYVDSLLVSGGIAVGDILRKPVVSTPSGFLRCNGGEVDKTTYADLYAVIGDSFDSNTTPGSGKPWQSQYQINLTQSSDLVWTTDSSSLPVGTYYSQAIVTKNRVYLLGGWNGAYTSAVYTAPINADGTLGAWAAGTALPVIVSLSQALITKNRVYLIGGYSDNGVRISTVLTTVINSDGTLGSWAYATNLPTAVGWSTAFITKDRLFLCGGVSVAGVSTSTVYTAPIYSDGTIGNWSLSEPLPSTMSGNSSFVTKKRVYVLAGNSGTLVYTAPINADGTLGSWVVSNSSLVAQIGAICVYCTKYRVYLLGGHNGSAYTNVVYSAPINADGTLGTFVTGTPLPGTLGTSVVIATKNKVYMLGGQNSGGVNITTIYSATINGGLNDYSQYYTNDTTNYLMSGSGLPWKQQYQFSETQITNIASWSTAGNLPVALAASSAIITKNRVYLLGGVTAANISVSTVYTAIINTDGTLGSWSTGTSLPGTLAYSQPIVTKNRVYLLGGSVSGTAVSTVYTAPINTDGTLGTWTTGTSLPLVLNSAVSIVTKNKVYLLTGKTTGDAYNTNIYFAPINADGTIGSWMTNSVFPTGLVNPGIFITKNRIYIAGGNTAGSTVYTATISSDGVIGLWSQTTSLPGALGYAQSLVLKNRAYLLGGYTSANNVSTVYSAPIDSDGILGTWTTGATLPGVLNQSQVIATKNHVFLLGGDTSNNAAYTSVIYSGTITDGLNDYSPYYDITLTGIDDNNYMMPGSGRPWENQYALNTTQSGDITGWTTSATGVMNIDLHICIVTKNRVYVGAGNANTMFTAPINSDGSLGTWTALGAVLPVSPSYASAVVTKNRAFIIGYTGTNAILTAPINADGTLGTWSSLTGAPVSFSFTTTFVTTKKLYVLSGSASGTTIYYAVINDDGTLGAWVQNATSFPVATNSAQALVTKNRVYVIGGSAGGPTTAVYTAPISTDGTVGAFVAGPSLLQAVEAPCMIATKNTVIIGGGYIAFNTMTNKSQIATINENGTIGNWSYGTVFPMSFYTSTPIITNGKIHLVGGTIGSGVFNSNIYTANFAGGVNDYSTYYDGTITATAFVAAVNSKFLLPDYSSEEPFGSYSYIKY